MSLRTSANRYAKALFDVALEEKVDLSTIAGDLDALDATLKANPELEVAVSRAGVPDANRTAIAEKVGEAMGLAAPVRKLFVMLTQGGKLELVPDLAAAFRERFMAHQNIVRADVTSAVPLSAEKTKALEESLAKVTGKKVELQVSVDPGLLGGVVARIGSTVYDGSVKTQLQKMRRELVEQ